MDYTVSEKVPEVVAEMMEPPAEMREPPAEMPAEMPTEPSPKPARAPRIRKVRIKPSAREASPPKPDHAFWAERLREHRAKERAPKDKRTGILAIVN